jgi:colanic acid biosynthesis protein WcaH
MRKQIFSEEKFLNILDATPLVSIDLVIRSERGRILLGKRVNRPAQGLWFVPGGRIRKNERIAEALDRIAQAELGVLLKTAQLLGAYDHIYEDNYHGRPGINTHYVVLGFTAKLNEAVNFNGDEQHSELRWWEVKELLASAEVHENTKNYFRPEVGHTLEKLRTES